MPWTQTTPMDQKMQFIADYLRAELSMTELCELYGISRKTGYKFVNRYLSEGPLKMYAEHGIGSLCVELKTTHEPVGICGLIKRPGLEDVDIGFAFLERHRGQGYGAESSLAILEHARRELQIARVVAITTPDNAASMALLAKIGLRYERDVALPSRTDPSRLFGIDLRK